MAELSSKRLEEASRDRHLFLYKKDEEGHFVDIETREVTLDEWLQLVDDPPEDTFIIDCTFPNNKLREEYLSTVHHRPLAEVKRLIKRFLPPSEPLGCDEKEEKGQKIRILVQVTRPHAPVRVGAVRQVQGIVASEGASKGVIVTTSRFTKEALDIEKKDARLELVAHKDFIRLMNTYLGTSWPSDIDRLIAESKREHLRRQEY